MSDTVCSYYDTNYKTCKLQRGYKKDGYCLSSSELWKQCENYKNFKQQSTAEIARESYKRNMDFLDNSGFGDIARELGL